MPAARVGGCGERAAVAGPGGPHVLLYSVGCLL